MSPSENETKGKNLNHSKVEFEKNDAGKRAYTEREEGGRQREGGSE